jgi:hypothetical protein
MTSPIIWQGTPTSRPSALSGVQLQQQGLASAVFGTRPAEEGPAAVVGAATRGVVEPERLRAVQSAAR